MFSVSQQASIHKMSLCVVQSVVIRTVTCVTKTISTCVTYAILGTIALQHLSVKVRYFYSFPSTF